MEEKAGALQRLERSMRYQIDGAAYPVVEYGLSEAYLAPARPRAQLLAAFLRRGESPYCPKSPKNGPVYGAYGAAYLRQTGGSRWRVFHDEYLP
jgi:hypothetical protein